MLWSEWIMSKLHEIDSPYQDYYHPGLEIQISPARAPKPDAPEVKIKEYDDLITRYGDAWTVRGSPYEIRFPRIHNEKLLTDGEVTFHPELVSLVGSSWWNFIDETTEGCYFDFDCGHGPTDLSPKQIAELDKLALRLPYVMNNPSKSGSGRHWFIKVPERLPAKTRVEHKRNCNAIMRVVCRDLDIDISPHVCSYGAIQYIFAKGK